MIQTVQSTDSNINTAVKVKMTHILTDVLYIFSAFKFLVHGNTEHFLRTVNGNNVIAQIVHSF